MNDSPTSGAPARHATGIAGLDDVLGGGLPAHRMYLVKGTPGVGKTTLALHFLREGARLGQRVLYITLSETADELRQVAQSHGWSLDGIVLFEPTFTQEGFAFDDENTLYAAQDVDLQKTVRAFLDELERIKPERVVFDSLSEIRLLAQTAIRYRRQLHAFKQYLIGRNCTALFLDDRSADADDLQVESLMHGAILLEQLPMQYGADRRRLRIAKLRGTTFRSGYHDFTVLTGGLEVFPRLVAAEHRSQVLAEPVSSGVAELDAMLGGGIDRSTCTLVMGPAGVGKSAIATQFALAAALRGETASIFLFEERFGTWRARTSHLNADLDRLLESKKVLVHQIDPAELAPDEFTNLVRDSVERGSRVVVIDSITGYFTAMPEARHLSLQMHELLSYLAERGVASIMTMAQSGLLGQMSSPVDVSYLADAVMLLRYFEQDATIRKAVSVLKKRSGLHEDTIRAFALDGGGLHVGPPLRGLQGIFSGMPSFEGEPSPESAA